MTEQWEALIVGVDEYPIYTTLHNLTVARKDAEDVAKQLEKYGYETFRIQRLPQQPRQKGEESNQLKSGVRLEELKDKITHLFNPPSRQEISDLALLFFSGHGWHQIVDDNDDVFLATSDVFPKAGIYGISLRWLGEEIERSSVKKVIVWLDCCFSGELMKYLPTNKNYCFITGTRSFETGLEISYKQGLFTKTLLEGLNPDNYADGIVDSNKLQNFIEKQMSATSQRPLIKNSQRSIVLTTRYSSQIFRDKCPYRSLSYFQETPEDATFFWGRSKLTNHLIERVQKSRFIGVLGASGSGKSSLLRAGLLYQLKLGQVLPGSNSWTYLTPFVPTENPLKQLNIVWDAASLNLPNSIKSVLVEERKQNSINSEPERSNKNKIIMVIDQFEECFTMCDENIRKTFFEHLIELLEKYSNLHIIMGMRSDFRGRLREYSELVTKIEKPYINVEHLNREEIEEVIQKPADLVGLQIEGSLKQQLINDVEDYPGSLPLLEYTLTQLWQETRKQGERFLTLKTYQALGGIEGTLEKRANEVFNSLDKNEQAIAKRIFLELTQVGDTFDTRRRFYLRDLVNSHHSLEELDQVTQKLANEKNRLIVRTEEKTLGEGKSEQQITKNISSTILIDVVHEALIRNWGRLRQWQDEYREGIVIERKIETAAQEWKNKQQKPEYLLQGSKLGEAREYIKSYGNLGMLDGIAESYIERSLRSKTFNTLRTWSVLIAVMLGLSTGLVFSLIGQRNSLINQAIASRNAAENSLRFNNSLDGMIQGLQAGYTLQDPLVKFPLFELFRSTDNLQEDVQNTLQWALYHVKEANRMRGDSTILVRSIVSPDNYNQQIIASAGEDGTIKLWDLQGKLLKSWNVKSSKDQASQRIWNVAFSPNAKLLASSGEDGIVRIWNLEEIQKLPNIHLKETPKHQAIQAYKGYAHGYVRYVSFSSDGKNLAIVEGEGGKGNIGLWDLQGNRLALWKADYNKQPVNFAKTVDFHPNNDQDIMVTIGMDQQIKIWDIKNVKQSHQPKPLSTLFIPQKDAIKASDITNKFPGWGAFFSPNGKHIVAAGNGGDIGLWTSENSLWNSEKQRVGKVWQAHQGSIWNVAFSADSQYIASGGEDGKVRIWNLKGKKLAQFEGHNGPVRSVKFTANSKQIVSSGDDGTTRLWNLPIHLFDHQNVDSFPKHEVKKNQPILSPDKKLLALVDKDNKIQITDVNEKNLNTFQDHIGKIWAINFSPNSQLLVTAGEDNTIRVWKDLDKQQQGRYSSIFQVKEKDRQNPLSYTNNDNRITAAIFSLDNQRIISGDNAGYIKIWDLKQNKKIAVWQVSYHGIKNLSFSSDGHLLATFVGQEDTMQLPLESLNQLIARGCYSIKDFLENNPDSISINSSLCPQMMLEEIRDLVTIDKSLETKIIQEPIVKESQENNSLPESVNSPVKEEVNDYWSGNWNHSFVGMNNKSFKGTMTLQLKDNQVTGNFTIPSINLTGTITEGKTLNNGRTLEGKWSNKSQQQGNFLFTLAPNNKGFSGYYSIGNQKIETNRGNSWNGSKLIIYP
ncbi:MAG: caspase family protein [Crocosphaera sp.]|nr:caspase family protein [Crocosphaera sp.]